MKIKSNFKDYYDFVGGAGDPKVVYNRIPLKSVVEVRGILPGINNSAVAVGVHIRWVVVVGRLYLLDDSSGVYKLSNNVEGLTIFFYNRHAHLFGNPGIHCGFKHYDTALGKIFAYGLGSAGNTE